MKKVTMKSDFNQRLRSGYVSKVEQVFVDNFTFGADSFDDRLLHDFNEGQIW